MNLAMIIGVTFGVAVVGGGIAYLIYIRTRPKKEIWKARVYQLSKGTIQPERDDKGNIISVALKDLIPYATDTLEKVEKDHGIVIYRLRKLNKATPAVESGVVDYWGKEHKEVNVLLDKGGCTLMRKGYDTKSGNLIFNPLSHSRINLIKSEMSIRKDRFQKEKDILQAITPWIVAGMCMLALVSITYIMVSGMVKISDNLESTVGAYNEVVLKVERMRQGEVPEPHDLGAQENVPDVGET